MNIELDLKKKIDNIIINLDGINKIKKSNLNFIFDEIKKSNNVEELFFNIKKCNYKIDNLNIFDGDPIVKLSSSNKNVIIDYKLKERKNNYMIGTNVNNRGEVTADFEINMPYIFKTINSAELKANICSLSTNNFSFRLLIPHLKYLANYRLILESNISSINNIKCSSYITKMNSIKTYLLKNNHSLIWEVNYNKILHNINKNFIPSEKILKLCDQYIKNTIKYNYKKDKLNYSLSSEKNEEVIYSHYPTSGYYYEIENEVSLPFCEAKFFKNHINFLYIKKLIENLYAYFNISNGIKYDYGKKNISYLNNFNFTGSIGSSLILRGFEYNSVGSTEECFKFDKKEKNYKINYNYLGANFFSNIQFIFKYILNFNNINPILFFYLQLGRLSNNLFPSFKQLINDTRISTGIGIMSYIQKNISLELFFCFPLWYQLTDKIKFFQVGLNFKGIL
ncbi:sorting assembly machinery 50 kDa subunit, putative [Plasmodium gallinaceum]|uniref:Sorting assembly machinery 50 kDa subunit, putative n=1 Tax=Plasmodium gallinaceum TaxID=5849 RepID=A0A1J1GMJ1_PLAGA|nr:sorting assembly machinery 50 kDa subunit, putative [Plasmodium gallinaceum]CRG93664.1 sorting assembly machinery 50 kDa subunit, putative [Plasmodium gallinaceum]